jgi:hypothetical protein
MCGAHSSGKVRCVHESHGRQGAVETRVSESGQVGKARDLVADSKRRGLLLFLSSWIIRRDKSAPVNLLPSCANRRVLVPSPQPRSMTDLFPIAGVNTRRADRV